MSPNFKYNILLLDETILRLKTFPKKTSDKYLRLKGN